MASNAIEPLEGLNRLLPFSFLSRSASVERLWIRIGEFVVIVWQGVYMEKGKGVRGLHTYGERV